MQFWPPACAPHPTPARPRVPSPKRGTRRGVQPDSPPGEGVTNTDPAVTRPQTTCPPAPRAVRRHPPQPRSPPVRSPLHPPPTPRRLGG